MKRPLSVMLSVVSVLLVAFGIVTGVVLSNNAPDVGWAIVTVACFAALVFGVSLWFMKGLLRPVHDAQSIAGRLLSLFGQQDQDRESRNELEELRNTLTQLSLCVQERLHALEEERAKVTMILDSMVEGVMALDRQGRIVVINPSARRILDLADEQVEARPLLEVVRNRDLADFVDQCQSLTNAEPREREVVLASPQRRVLEINAIPLALVAQQRGLILVLHDITELRRLERVRAEFVANVSHELRTPLTAIKGYLETLLDETSPDPAMYRRFLGVAHSHADRLGRLVKDLMNLSDIEAGKVCLKQEPLSLMEVVNEVSGIYEREAVKKGITFENRVAADVQVYADRDRVSQIIVNLLDNALKYTASNGQVTFSTVSSNGASGPVTLEIRDTGQGIPPSDLSRITERFYRVDKARSREEGGTGLGLAIVKHLVHLQGGTIHIDSTVGKGTTVKVVLPAQASSVSMNLA